MAWRQERFAPRHLRMTDADRQQKVRRQRERRKETNAAPTSYRKIGATQEDYETRFALQQGKCDICGKRPLKGKRLHFDHCHRTGQLRGLLCWSCNAKLGWVEKWLLQITKYLRRHKSNGGD